MQQIPQPGDGFRVVDLLNLEANPHQVGEIARQAQAKIVADEVIVELLDNLLVGEVLG